MQKIKHRAPTPCLNPISYLETVVGIENKYIEKKKEVKVNLSAVVLCHEYGNHGNCTLVAMHNVLSYLLKEESSRQFNGSMYEKLKAIAITLGYKPNLEKGLSVLKNRKYGKTVAKTFFEQEKAKSETSVFNTDRLAIELCDRNLPFVLSLAYGLYYDHSITVYGYSVYEDVRTGKEYTFLNVCDGWVREERFVPWTHTGLHYPVCITYIEPRA